MNLNSFTSLITNLWKHMTRRRKIQFLLLLVMIALGSVAEMFSIGAVVPFISALVNPEKVFSHPLSQPIISALDLQHPKQIIVPLTIVFCIFAVVAGIFRILLLYASTRFSFSVGADLSIDVYRRTMYQPYIVHVSRNSSEIINGITGKIAMLISSILTPFLNLISSMSILTGIFVTLIAIDPIIAITSGASIGAIYVAVAFTFKRHLRENSECIARESTRVIQALQEGLGGIRDVLIDGTQDAYCDVYRNADRPLRLAQARNTFASTSPRYFMEMLGMIVIATLAASMTQSQSGGISDALPVLGALALGAQRLLPLLQQVYNAYATIVGAEASLRDALALLNQPIPEYADHSHSTTIKFDKRILLENVGFQYGNNNLWAVRGININIPKGSKVGFIGETGAGKSTLIDLIMALLSPTEGEIFIDDQAITQENFRSWQSRLAHVPQSIFLSDTTIAENIAFGAPQDNIDMNRVREAAKKAQIASVIEALPRQYSTVVGERGVRLSGGQRQRVGIARALYKKADTIILDEATSALDSVTERAVMDAIENLGNGITILIIAHRTTTLRNCDFIISMQPNGTCRKIRYQDLETTQ